MGAIYKREMYSYFTSPIAYVVIGIMFLFSARQFSNLFTDGNPQISYVFQSMFLFVLLCIPILTSKLLCDEAKLKTDQVLFTAPIKLRSIVLGKYFAALTVFSMSISCLLVYQLIFAAYTPANASVDWLVFFGNLAGMLLLGCSLIALGLFISSITESLAISIILSFATSFVLLLVDSYTSAIKTTWIKTILDSLSFYNRYTPFTTGKFSYSDAMFFISIAAIFIFLTIRILDKKRWA